MEHPSTYLKGGDSYSDLRFRSSEIAWEASLLSKMELPIFDGYIFEFPEFSSKFATLVGNKAELDATTKFSALKFYEAVRYTLSREFV